MSDKLPLQPERIDEAHARILDWIRKTPTVQIQGPGARPVVLKLECLQRSGSFKLRGALNKLMTLGEKARRGVITASGGNHGLGVAWAGWLLGVPVHVFVPENTPSLKREALERANAVVLVVRGRYPEAEAAAREMAERESFSYIHAYDDPDIIAGQGTVTREFLEQEPDIRTLVVAIGGGGLAAGAVLAGGDRNIVGVEPHGAPTMYEALRAGGPIRLSRIESAAADSLGAGIAGKWTFKVCRDGLERVELVSESSLVAAQRWLWEHTRVVCELGAAAGLAALAEGMLNDDPGPIGIVICGANVDPRKFVQ